MVHLAHAVARHSSIISNDLGMCVGPPESDMSVYPALWNSQLVCVRRLAWSSMPLHVWEPSCSMRARAHAQESCSYMGPGRSGQIQQLQLVGGNKGEAVQDAYQHGSAGMDVHVCKDMCRSCNVPVPLRQCMLCY